MSSDHEAMLGDPRVELGEGHHPVRIRLGATLHCLDTATAEEIRAGLERVLGESDDARRRRVLDALGMSRPWPVTDVLDKLADAAEHLMVDHDCDQLGWEMVNDCIGRGRGYAAALRAALGKPPDDGAALECPCCGDVGATADSEGLYYDGQPLECGCPGQVSLDSETPADIVIHDNTPCPRCHQGLDVDLPATCPDCGAEVNLDFCTTCHPPPTGP